MMSWFNKRKEEKEEMEREEEILQEREKLLQEQVNREDPIIFLKRYFKKKYPDCEIEVIENTTDKWYITYSVRIKGGIIDTVAIGLSLIYIENLKIEEINNKKELISKYKRELVIDNIISEREKEFEKAIEYFKNI